MSDHPQEIVALAQAIGAAVQIQPSTLSKENEEAVSDLIAGFIAPLIERNREQEMDRCCDAVRNLCPACNGTGYDHGLQCEYCCLPINAIKTSATKAKGDADV